MCDCVKNIKMENILIRVLNKYIDKEKNRYFLFNQVKEKNIPLHLLYNFILNFKSEKSIDNIRTILTNFLSVSESSYWNGLESNENKILDEDDEMKKHVIQIEEGPVVCRRCNGKKVMSINKITRARDEPITVFSNCVTCKYSWKQ